MILHAGCAALRVEGLWRGVLLTGPSGVGKSDLLARLGDAGWRLVADDRAIVWSSCGRLFARAPAALAGLIELRGLGVAGEAAIAMAEVVLVAPAQVSPERMPEAAVAEIAGVALPCLPLAPLEAPAPAKLRHALFAAVRRRLLEPGGDGRI